MEIQPYEASEEWRRGEVGQREGEEPAAAAQVAGAERGLHLCARLSGHVEDRADQEVGHVPGRRRGSQHALEDLQLHGAGAPGWRAHGDGPGAGAEQHRHAPWSARGSEGVPKVAGSPRFTFELV